LAELVSVASSKNAFRLTVLSFIATCLALIVIGLGAYTRLTDAGLGCPDWPGCYGHLFEPNTTASPTIPVANKVATTSSLLPQAGEGARRADEGSFINDQPIKENVWAVQAWTEMIHRYAAGTLGLLVLGLFILALRSRATLPWKIPCILAVLIVWQALLGMWTVTLKLHPTIVMAHLLGGFTTLTLLWLYHLQIQNKTKPLKLSLPKIYTPLVVTSLTLLILQIALGGWTSANYAALACLDFPQCQAAWLPTHNFYDALTLWHSVGPNFEFGLLDNAARMTIHMMHRLGALLTTLVLTLTCGIILKTTPHLHKIVWIIIALLCLQVALGITNILAILPLGIAVMHNMVAALLLLSVVTLTYYVCISDKKVEKK